MPSSNAESVNASKKNSEQATLDINAIDSIGHEVVYEFYNLERLTAVVISALDYINEQLKTNLVLPYFTDIDTTNWQQKPKAVDIYVTDAIEGRELNLAARGKDYPTNILSYPSELPASVLELMPTLPLGELIICHEVVVREAAEQDKRIAQHLTHLVVHGLLHLLGFDHEIGQAEQNQMEGLEIAILANLDVPNPYE